MRNAGMGRWRIGVGVTLPGTPWNTGTGADWRRPPPPPSERIYGSFLFSGMVDVVGKVSSLSFGASCMECSAALVHPAPNPYTTTAIVSGKPSQPAGKKQRYAVKFLDLSIKLPGQVLVQLYVRLIDDCYNGRCQGMRVLTTNKSKCKMCTVSVWNIQQYLVRSGKQRPRG